MPNTAPSDEAFLYLHTDMEQDSYTAITMAIPPEVINSKCLKGIVLLSHSKAVGATFWPTPYMTNEELLPIYLVGVEDGLLLLQKVQPQQPLKVGPVQAQGSEVQLNIPKAVHIRFMPVSGGKLSLNKSQTLEGHAEY